MPLGLRHLRRARGPGGACKACARKNARGGPRAANDGRQAAPASCSAATQVETRISRRLVSPARRCRRPSDGHGGLARLELGLGVCRGRGAVDRRLPELAQGGGGRSPYRHRGGATHVVPGRHRAGDRLRALGASNPRGDRVRTRAWRGVVAGVDWIKAKLTSAPGTKAKSTDVCSYVGFRGRTGNVSNGTNPSLLTDAVEKVGVFD